MSVLLVNEEMLESVLHRVPGRVVLLERMVRERFSEKQLGRAVRRYGNVDLARCGKRAVRDCDRHRVDRVVHAERVENAHQGARESAMRVAGGEDKILNEPV